MTITHLHRPPAVAPVPHGTAEALARIHHFRQLTATLPEAHELDPVIRGFIGRVADHAEVMEHLHDELDRLWSLITNDHDEDLDEIPEADWTRYDFATQRQEEDHRLGITIERLASDVEGYIVRKRYELAELSRMTRLDTALLAVGS